MLHKFLFEILSFILGNSVPDPDPNQDPDPQGLLDPDPNQLVRDVVSDLGPSIIKQKK